MIRDLQKRLARLERNQPPQQTAENNAAGRLPFFLLHAIGYYLGDPQPGEAPAEATARGLGYGHGEFSEALRLSDAGSDLNLRYEQANQRLFSKFGLNLDELASCDGAEFVNILRRMYAGMSPRYKDLADTYLRFD